MLSAAVLITLWTGVALSVPTSLQTQRRWDNGLAQTPPMGWNSYNHYSCAPNESIIMSNAKALVDFGLADLGYTYATTDCGWTIPDRTANGTITWNETLFPSGFPALGDYIHSLGLYFGVYSDSGIQMCMTGGVNQTGSLNYEQTDADTFAAWGADLLKYDNCYSEASEGYPVTDYTPAESPSTRFNTMKEALVNTGRSILYQICEWGLDFPSAWAPAIGNSWRVTNDIIPQWSTVYRIVNQVVSQTSFAGPHQWLDLDMLEVGNNIFSIPEEQTHFSLWAILKSPLVIGAALNDTVRTISSSSLEILKNKDVISYNQDSLGVAANLTRRWSDAGYDVWSGPLSGDRVVAALVNWNDYTLEATLDLPDVGLQSAGSVKDIWNDVTASNVKTSYKQSVPAHGTLLLELSETQPAGYYSADDYAVIDSDVTTFSDIYALTSSTSYNLTISFSAATTTSSTLEIESSATNTSTTYTVEADSSSFTTTITLLAGNTNTLTLTSSASIASIIITAPEGTFYPSTSFATTGSATTTTCDASLCAPVGAKIGYLSPSGTANLTIPFSSSASSSSSVKYVELTYINNAIALETSWTAAGRNARNLTLRVNDGAVVRVEVPISGRSSELFSPMGGWGDSATLGVLVGGWSVAEGEETEGDDVLVVGNESGADGYEVYGADFVGLRVF